MNAIDEWPHNWFGYWSYGVIKQFPSLEEAIDTTWSPCDKNDIVSYLHRGLCVGAVGTTTPCPLCPMELPVDQLSDGEWVWITQLGHLVACHSVIVPHRFVEHMRKRSFVMPTRIECRVAHLPWPEGSAMKKIPTTTPAFSGSARSQRG